MKKIRIFLRGKPGIGKTTVIINLINKLPKEFIKGFFTQEVRISNKRIGFDVIDLNANKAILARINISTPYKVGNYCVDIESFEKIAIPSLIPMKSTKLFIIDEIGKMECYSKVFLDNLIKLFDSDYSILATIPIYYLPIIEKINSVYKPEIIEVTISNRNYIVSKLVERFASLFQ
jgi:nucleoside-triphosphatase THEP1